MRLDEDGNAFKVDFVSIHASVKDATRSSAGGLTMPCFNPRICKRCDQDIRAYLKHRSVSIHASVKDATVGVFSQCHQETVSIHASVKDATRKDEILNNPSLVSIHASVKDATL